MTSFVVSVVIPAFNAERFLRKAAESALALEDVKEVVVVDDGSTDGTREVCELLQQRSQKVKVYQHSEKRNRGPSETRNLGIERATCDYIAFLDADDYYLPNRFDEDKRIFRQRPNIDGVYGAVKAAFLTPGARKRFRKSKMPELTTVRGEPSPEELLYVLLGDHPNCSGHIHLDALTVRRSIFRRCGLFDKDLELGQDTDIIIRMATTSQLVPGSTDTPVAVRGVHDSNRVTNRRKQDRSWWFLFTKLRHWGGANGMPERAQSVLKRKALIRYPYSHAFLERLRFLLSLGKEHPELRNDPNAHYRIALGVFRSRILGGAYIRARKLMTVISSTQGNRS